MVYVEIFKLWKWENVALLAEDGQNFPEYHTFLKDLFLSRSIQVVYDRKIPRQASFEEASKVRIEFGIVHSLQIQWNLIITLVLGSIHWNLIITLILGSIRISLL